MLGLFPFHFSFPFYCAVFFFFFFSGKEGGAREKKKKTGKKHEERGREGRVKENGESVIMVYHFEVTVGHFP